MTFILGWHQTNSTNSEYESCLDQNSEASKLSLGSYRWVLVTVAFLFEAILLWALDLKKNKSNFVMIEIEDNICQVLQTVFGIQ